MKYTDSYITMAIMYLEAYIILKAPSSSSGLSKWCGAGGWRLSTFTFPRELNWLCDKMAVIASETNTSVSAPIKYAAVVAFKGGIQIEEYLWSVRKILASIGNESARLLQKAGIKVYDPVGGFYLFLDFSNFTENLHNMGIMTSKELCTKLLEDTGVAILHGSSFGRPKKEFSARMAYVDFDDARALAAAKTIPLSDPLQEGYNEKYCAKILEGVLQITKWVQNL